MNTKYIIMIAGLLAVIHYLLAGSAPIATPARVAPQARVGPVAPSSVAPSATVAPVAPIGSAPAAAVAPVAPSPVAPTAPVSPAQPYAYTFTSGSVTRGTTRGTNSRYFTNGIPTAYLRNTNSVSWATNPPYGNPVEGYTNKTGYVTRPHRPTGNTSSPSIQQH